MQRYILILFLIISSFNLNAQTYSTQKKSAIKQYERANEYFMNRAFNPALEHLDEALKKDPYFIEAYLFKAEIYNYQNRMRDEIEMYKKVLQINKDYDLRVQYRLSMAYFSIAKYKEAYESIQEAQKEKCSSKDLKEAIEEQYLACKDAYRLFSNPVPFEPKNLGKGVNTQYDDYWPMLSVDGRRLYTTKKLPKNPNYPVSNQNINEDFFINVLDDNGQWSRPYSFGKPLNTIYNEGAPSISADGQTFVFTACNRPDGYGRCDIYISHKEGESWSQPVNIGRPINTPYLERQPSLSADGKTLYFASNRKGTRGKEDIWVSHLVNGVWTEPLNMGDSINSDGVDFSPFIHPDGQSFYFISNGHLGLGGLDIFKSDRINDTLWTRPVNLGYPINNIYDQHSLFVSADGMTALLSSNHESQGKDLDIYSFPLYPEARPKFVGYVQGIVSDKASHRPLQATLELIDLESGKTIMMPESNSKDGSYLLCLPANKDYMFNINKDGYLPFSQHFGLKNKNKVDPLTLNIELEKIQINTAFVLNNIFFELDAYQLKPVSKLELNKLIQFLKNNSNLKIEIGGHTDNQGSSAYNQKLSSQRARAVYQYLTKHQIDAGRLTYKGYGESLPIESNETKKGRAKNRRTTFKITGM